MSDKAIRSLPRININVGAILDKADNDSKSLSYSSSLSGIGYAIDKNQILIVGRHGFFMERIEDMRVIVEELNYLLEEAERWQRS